MISRLLRGRKLSTTFPSLEDSKTGKQPTKPLSTLSGHSHRVCKLSFHPSGKYLASASYDGTWRLWDVNSSKELLLQEGHSKELYSIAFQPDEGSLLASGGLDAIGRVWDVRSGRSVMVLDGHIRDILSLDWSPGTAYQLASGSNDDTVKIWDLRMIKCLYTIPAHKSTVSEVKFFRAADGMQSFPVTLKPARSEAPKVNGQAPHAGQQNGASTAADVKPEEEEKKPDISTIAKAVDDGAAASGWAVAASARRTPVPLSGMYLATSGYDGYVRMWSADDWQLVKSLNSEAGGRVMSVDLSQGQSAITFILRTEWNVYADSDSKLTTICLTCADGKFLATGEWSRTFKLFAAQNVAL